MRVGIGTAPLTERPAAAITFVIDTSGSMDIRERLGLVKSSLALLVEHLRADDTIAIDALGPGGSTNMEAGLLLGDAHEARAVGGVRLVAGLDRHAERPVGRCRIAVVEGVDPLLDADRRRVRSRPRRQLGPPDVVRMAIGLRRGRHGRASGGSGGRTRRAG